MDDLQPQDLSTCSIPSVVDLTRKGEASSLEAMHMVSPRWYPNSGNGRTGLPLTDAASSDIVVQSGEQIQSDDAFSNTTATLSYVSRSHVFSSQDSLATHSSLYTVPSISKFSLQPSCEPQNGLGQADYALSQHYLQHSDGPIDLATRTQLFQALAQAQVGGESNESQLCLTQPGSHGLNGDLANRESVPSLENGGQCHNWPTSGQSSLNAGEPQGSGHLGQCELLLVPEIQEPSVVGEGAAGGELPSEGREYSSSLEDSTSATSPDQGSVTCPQASRPPSAVNAYSVEDAEVIWVMLDTENTIEPFPSEEAESSSDCTLRLDVSTEPSSPAHECEAAPHPTDELTDRGECLKENNAKVDSAVVPHINGNEKTLPGISPPRRKLPDRIGRGTRLEAFVLNICPSAYKDRKCKTAPKATKTTTDPAKSPSPPGKKSPLRKTRQKKASVSPSKRWRDQAKTKQKVASRSKVGKTDHINSDNCKDSTSDCEIFNNSKNLHNGTPSKTAASRFSAQAKSKQVSTAAPQASDTDATAQQRLNLEPGEIVFPYTLAEVKVQTPTKSPKKSPSVYKGRATGGGISPTKAARPPKRKLKSPPGGHPSSMFSPREPEIKLKYVNYKEERRDPRLDSFSPLVRMHRQPSSSCLYTVINYAEEDTTRQGGLQQGSSGSFLSGAMPGTSCLQPGRVSVHGQHYRSLVCCLCGTSANAQGLGDLHGPYYPEGYRTIGKTKASLKTNTVGEGEEEEGGDEDDSSDSSDSSASSCSMQCAGGKQRARPPPGSWPQRGGVHLQQKGASGSPATKQARMDCRGMLEEGEVVDWYSPPVVAQEPCEYWLHEDCSVWAAGVFLVKGKVYGLEEAVKVAQATVRL